MRKEDGSIYYPFGRLRGSWTFAEIRQAVNCGGKIVKINQAFGTQKTNKYYADYVTEIYDKRLNSRTDAHKLFYKLLMNNLYGQLGMSGIVTESLNYDPTIEGTPYGSKILADIEMPLPDHVNYIHAAYITSYARIELFNFLQLIGEKNIVYCDTDSAIFTGEIPFETGKKLGQMKLEGKFSYCETYAPKMYRVDDNYKAKGVPKRLQKEFIDNGRASWQLPFRFREAATFFDRNNAKKLSVWHDIEKINRKNYSKKKFDNGIYYPKLNLIA